MENGKEKEKEKESTGRTGEFKTNEDADIERLAMVETGIGNFKAKFSTQKQVHERVLLKLFEWFSAQNDLSSLLLPPENLLKKSKTESSTKKTKKVSIEMKEEKEMKQSFSDMKNPRSLVHSRSEEHSISVLNELIDFCVEQHQAALDGHTRTSLSEVSAIQLLAGLQRDLIVKSRLFASSPPSAPSAPSPPSPPSPPSLNTAMKKKGDTHSKSFKFFF